MNLKKERIQQKLQNLAGKFITCLSNSLCRPPRKHAKSEFIQKTDAELDEYIDRKRSDIQSDTNVDQIFSIIEPIFRIKSKELNPGLYCFPFR